jgi:hypothetical protein
MTPADVSEPFRLYHHRSCFEDFGRLGIDQHFLARPAPVSGIPIATASLPEMSSIGPTNWTPGTWARAVNIPADHTSAG